ncbi:hypothetical protein, partial [Glutamicibacter sp. V16R2B1]|uniref:hypothetical protein n=1 Tax=Glutamicibacter sp. V16R2B1 TaxID=2036207 RepID=UPI00127ECBF7
MTAPSTGLELLRLALTEMEAADPRALQVETGASQAIGCRAESLFRLLGVPESDSRLRLDALIGKAAHAYAEEALKKVADRFELLVEHRASYRGVPCTIDLGWVGAAKLIDWKFPRKSKISWMQKNGIGNGYRGQIHLGGAALRAEGYDIQTVGLACLARDGEFDEAVEFVEPFDQQIADAAADRVAEERARATEMEGILDRLAVDEAGKAVEVRHAIDMWQLRDEDLFFCRSFCLAGETEIVTRQGLRPISDLAGSKPELLIPVAHRGGIGSRTVWKNCEVRSFGHQPLMRIKLRRIRATKIVFATPEHRWLTRDGSKVITSDLKDGMKLRSIRRGDIDHLVQVAPGVAQGV